MSRSMAEDILIQSSRLPWWVCLLLAYVSYLVLDHFAIDPGVQPDTTGVQIGTMGSFAAKYMYGYFAHFAKFLLPAIFILAGIASILKSKKISPFSKFAIITATVIVGWAIFQSSYKNLAEPINSAGNNSKKIEGKSKIELSKEISISKERAQAISQHNEEQAGRPHSIEKDSPKKYTLYSWKEEDGYRGYSNNGFPKDRPYSDPRVEFH